MRRELSRQEDLAALRRRFSDILADAYTDPVVVTASGQFLELLQGGNSQCSCEAMARLGSVDTIALANTTCVHWMAS